MCSNVLTCAQCLKKPTVKYGKVGPKKEIIDLENVFGNIAVVSLEARDGVFHGSSIPYVHGSEKI